MEIAFLVQREIKRCAFSNFTFGPRIATVPSYNSRHRCASDTVAGKQWVMPRSKPPVSLSTEQRKQLLHWLAAQGTPQQVALRCRIVLAAADGQSDPGIATDLKMSRPTVILWRVRFAAPRSGKFMADRSRPGPQAHLWGGEDQSGGGCHVTEQTQRHDAMELSPDGEKPGVEQVHGQQYLA